MEIGGIERPAYRPERMEVAVAESRPVGELDAELESTAGLADEIALIDAEQLIENMQRRDRRLPDSNGADLRGLDDLDLAVARLQHSRQGRRGHPAGRPPAHDDDFAHASIARVSGRQHDCRLFRRPESSGLR